MFSCYMYNTPIQQEEEGIADTDFCRQCNGVNQYWRKLLFFTLEFLFFCIDIMGSIYRTNNTYTHAFFFENLVMHVIQINSIHTQLLSFALRYSSFTLDWKHELISLSKTQLCMYCIHVYIIYIGIYNNNLEISGKM